MSMTALENLADVTVPKASTTANALSKYSIVVSNSQRDIVQSFDDSVAVIFVHGVVRRKSNIICLDRFVAVNTMSSLQIN